MKIAIVGAHQVGKTTLAEELMNHLPDYTMVREPYYALEDSGYEFSDQPSVEDFVIQVEYSLRRISNDEDNVIFDRFSIDLLAYLHALDPERDIQQLFEKIQESIRDIDLLVFVPVETPDLIPQHLVQFPKLRNEVDSLLHEWIPNLGIETMEVKGTISKRSDLVLARLAED